MSHKAYISPRLLFTVAILLIVFLFSVTSQARMMIDCDQVRIDTMKIKLAYDEGKPFEATYIKYQGSDDYNIRMRYVAILVYQGHSDSMTISEFGDLMRDLCVVKGGE